MHTLSMFTAKVVQCAYVGGPRRSPLHETPRGHDGRHPVAERRAGGVSDVVIVCAAAVRRLRRNLRHGTRGQAGQYVRASMSARCGRAAEGRKESTMIYEHIRLTRQQDAVEGNWLRVTAPMAK